jgi:Tfp pilus assembly protein PilZ
MEKKTAVEDRRVSLRVRIRNLMASVRITQLWQSVADVGMGGMRITSNKRYGIGEVLDLEFFHATEGSLTCTARVVWINKLPKGGSIRYELGLQFQKLPEGADDFLTAVMEKSA